MQWTGGPELSYGGGLLFVGGSFGKKFNRFYAVNPVNGRALGQDFEYMFSNKAVGRDKSGDPINPKRSLWGLKPKAFGSTKIAPVFHRGHLFVWWHRKTKMISDLDQVVSNYEQGVITEAENPLELAFTSSILAPIGDQVALVDGKDLIVKEFSSAKDLWKSKISSRGDVVANGLSVVKDQIILVTDAGEVKCYQSDNQ